MAKISKEVKKRIFVSTEPLEALYQEFDPETGAIKIYDGSRKIWEGIAEVGDFFIVTHKANAYQVCKRRLPRLKHSFIMWLFGFPKNLQFDSVDGFNEQLTHHRAEHMADPGYQEHQYAGVGYGFAFYSTEADPTPQRVAAWVTPGINRKLAKEILSIQGLNIAGMIDAEMNSLGREIQNRFSFRNSDCAEINEALLAQSRQVGCG
ncbi:hypothetical protein IKF76_01210 [Candidatus Saccharibacteria bacterium]|nr:hypothetical protein [Candidatus Saccharibacteria bacterium]